LGFFKFINMEKGDVYFDNVVHEAFQIVEIKNDQVFIIWLDDGLVQSEDLEVLKQIESDGIIEKYTYG